LEVTHLWVWPYETIHHLADGAAAAIGTAQGFIGWVVTAFFDGIFGLILGVALIPVATRVIGPAVAAITGKKKAAH
jgi:predicted DNA repair protein MutK